MPTSAEKEVNFIKEHGTFIYQNYAVDLAAYLSQLVRIATKEALMTYIFSYVRLFHDKKKHLHGKDKATIVHSKFK